MSRIGKSTETEHRPGVPKGWGVLVTGVTANGYRVILRGDEHALELDGGDVFRKGRGTRDQIANIRGIIKKAREFRTNIYFCFIDYAKAFDCVDHNKLWKILKEMGIPDHLTCFLRNLYAGQEATVRTGPGTTD